MKQMIIPIKGMHCHSCELLLEEKIKQVQGVRSVSVSYRDGQAVVRHGGDIPSQDELRAAIRDAGYDVGPRTRSEWMSSDPSDYKELLIAALIIGAIYLAGRALGVFGIQIDTKSVSLPMAVVVGLVAGISTCMALVGGLVLGLAARHAELHPEATPWQKFRPHLFFNLGRVGGYAFFGGLLGAVGGVLKLSNGLLAALTLAVGAVMVVLGLKLTGISPRLKEGGLALPSWIARGLGLNRHRREYSHGSAMLTGALTFFLPCGFTQAMQVFAVSTGSYGRGAAVMAFFALGTAPALLGIGGLTSVIKGAVARRFYAVVGLAVLVFGVLNVGNGLVLAGFDPYAAQLKRPAVGAETQDGVQVVRMTQNSGGYTPNVFSVRAGVPVRWIITSESEFTCSASIVMPSQNVSRRLTLGENVIEFTPVKAGSIPFSCAMGMYRGVFNVTDGPAGAAAVAPQPAAAPSGSSCGAGGGGCGCGGGAARPKVAGGVDAAAGVQRIASRDNYGLSPNEFTVRAGQPVEWTITPDAPPAGCMVAFVNRDLGIGIGENYPEPTVVRFTPAAAGDYPVTCGMGMWRATIHVQ